MNIRYLTAGESHGPALVTILEGLPAGLQIDQEALNYQLLRRQTGYGSGPRMKLEKDHARIISGVLEGITTGAPIAMSIENLNHERWRGKSIEPFSTPRPGHVDLAAAVKYGYRDLRPGLERASARETAARVAVGALCRQFLEQFNIHILGYVVSIGEVTAQNLNSDYQARYREAESNTVRSPDAAAAMRMEEEIRQVIEAKDTLGGIIEIVALNIPPGLGSHVQWDRRLEARLAAAVLSVQAMKGIEFGAGFAVTRLRGTQAHDPIRLEGERIIRSSNQTGGIEGGITTGQPLIFRAAMKPIATTLTPQPTVDLGTGEEVPTQYERSDFCPVPRAVPILEAVTAIELADAMSEKLGGDSLTEMQARFENLRQLRLKDLTMDNQGHIFWPET